MRGPPTFRDARAQAEDAVEECDVCIIGTGAAGVTAALRLTDPKLRICVLEAGGHHPDPATDSVYELEWTDLPIGGASRLRYLGGTTNAWWGGVALLHDMDMAPRPWIGGAHWPVQPSELTRYWREAAGLMGVMDLTGFNPGAVNERRGAVVRTDALDVATMYWPRHPTRFGELYRRAVAGRPEVATWLHANVTEVILDQEGNRVERLVVRTINGLRFFVRPRITILACGGIENARLLLASRSQQPRGVGNDFDQLGRYFMDHPKGVCGVVRTSSRMGGFLHPAYTSGLPGIRLGLRLSDQEQARAHALNSYLRLHPILDGKGADALRRAYGRGLRTLSDPRLLQDLVLHAPDALALLWFRMFNRGRVPAFAVENFMELEPRAENRVCLSNDSDLFGAPRAKLTWSVSGTDMSTMRLLHRRLDEEVRRRSIGSLDSPLLAGDVEPWPITRDASHHMGTTRMGTDPRSSVVDPDCRVHGIENLYVAGSSVFPTSGYANPTLTIVALALRLADHLRRTALR